jgi:hypothetical protein
MHEKGVGWILREMASDQAKPRSDAMDVGGPKIEVPKKPTVERVQSKVFPIASVQTNLFCLVHQLVRERYPFYVYIQLRLSLTIALIDKHRHVDDSQ